MKIAFHSLTAQNFKSIGEETTIDFDSLNPVSLIKGMNKDVAYGDDGREAKFTNNGSGKSTMIDAIVFALYGKTLCNAVNRSIVNRSIGNRLKTFSRLHFSIGDDDYVSEAYLSGSANPTVGFRFTKNGEQMERTTNQMRRTIEDEIIGCPFDLFSSSVVISQSSYQNFYMMTKGQKMAYVDELFKLQVFGELLKIARSDMRSSTSEYNAMNMTRMSHVSTLQDMSLKSASFESDMKGKRDRIETGIRMKEEAIEIAKKELSKLPPPEDVVDLQKSLLEMRSKSSNLMVMITKCNSGLSAARTRKQELEKLIGKHKEVIDILCDKCMEKADKMLSISASKEQIEKCEEQIRVLSSHMAKFSSEQSENGNAMEEMQSRINSSKDMSHRIEMMTNQLEHLNSDLEGLKSMLDDCDGKENPFTGLMEGVKAKISDVEKSMQEKSKEVKVGKFLEYVFNDSGVKNSILEDIAKSTNMLISHYLKTLGANYSVVLDPSFNASFMTDSGESQYESFSSGERQRIQMATMMAFRDMIVGNRTSSNMMILDEVLDSALDSQGVSSIVSSIVSMIKDKNMKLMIISHNPAVEKRLMEMNEKISIVTAVKEDSKTKYVVE